jgi:hypothetical protein
MKMLSLAAFAGIALLAQMPVNAQPVQRPPVSQQHPNHSPIRPNPQQPIPVHFCAAGTSWQYGCVQWAPAGPGQLFGACLRSAWSCKRVAGPIQ